VLQNISQAMLEHGCDDRQSFRIRYCRIAEELDQVEEIERSIKINLTNVKPKEDAEADGPQRCDIPPVSQAMGHDPEAASFAAKFGCVAVAVGDEQPRQNFAAVNDNGGIVLR